MLVRGVVEDEIRDHAQAEFVRAVEERLEILQRAVVGMNLVEIGDVVAIVLQRRGIEGEEPDAIHAEPAGYTAVSPSAR